MNHSSGEYYLMHKDIPVCRMQISDEGSISRVRRNRDQSAHFPLGGQIRIPLLKELYQRKVDSLRAFQKGKDIWIMPADSLF